MAEERLQAPGLYARLTAQDGRPDTVIYPDDPPPDLPHPDISALRARVKYLEETLRQVWEIITDLRLAMATQEQG